MVLNQLSYSKCKFLEKKFCTDKKTKDFYYFEWSIVFKKQNF